MSRRGKVVYTVLAGLLLLALYGVIFCFSAQDGETSGGISFQFSKYGVELWNELTNRGWSEQIRLQWANYFEHPVRKMAHFMEYALMGFLQYSLLRCHLGKRKVLIGVTACLTAVSAAADEIHQLFVPGRYGCFADVCLDTCGGIFGVFVCMLLIRMVQKIRKIRKNRAKRT